MPPHPAGSAGERRPLIRCHDALRTRRVAPRRWLTSTAADKQRRASSSEPRITTRGRSLKGVFQTRLSRSRERGFPRSHRWRAARRLGRAFGGNLVGRRRSAGSGWSPALATPVMPETMRTQWTSANRFRKERTTVAMAAEAIAGGRLARLPCISATPTARPPPRPERRHGHGHDEVICRLRSIDGRLPRRPGFRTFHRRFESCGRCGTLRRCALRCSTRTSERASCDGGVTERECLGLPNDRGGSVQVTSSDAPVMSSVTPTT